MKAEFARHDGSNADFKSVSSLMVASDAFGNSGDRLARNAVKRHVTLVWMVRNETEANQ